MLKIHLKLMAFVMVSITLYEKIITSDDELSNNLNSSQLVTSQLDLRRSQHYSGVAYDVNRKETPEERARYYNLISSILGHKLSLPSTVQPQERNLLFISMPEIASVTSLDSIQANDSDDDSQNSAVTDKWSTAADAGVFDDVDTASSLILSIRKTISLNQIDENSDTNINVKEIHELQDADFEKSPSRRVSFDSGTSFEIGKKYFSPPCDSPKNLSPKIESDEDGDRV